MTSAMSKSRALGSIKWHTAHPTLLHLCVTVPLSQDPHSNPRPRHSVAGVAAVMCPQDAQTSVQSATHVARAGRGVDGRRRPRKSQSSDAGHRAVTTTRTKRNRATATSVTTLNRFIAADHIGRCPAPGAYASQCTSDTNQLTS